MSYLAKRDAVQTALEKENRKIAHLAALEGMVLLENDGTLPFCDVKKIALFGNGARKTVKGGTGSGDVNERECISIEQGLKNAGYQIVTEDWLSRYDGVWEADRISWKKELEEIAEERNVPFVIAYLETLHLLPTMDIKEEEMKEADAAVYVISRRSGEGIDRVAEKGDYYLSDEEQQGLKMLKAHYQKLVVIINAGGPVDTVFINKEIEPSALLVMSQAGMEGGNALADLLSGIHTPSGKLTDTWAFCYEDYPEAGNFSIYSKNPREIFYREGIYVGYRYFATADKRTAYCFGYGKSYTDFQIVWEECTLEEENVKFLCKVKNIGKYRGKEVVQIYMKAPKGKLGKPSRVLTGFVKTNLLAPGEEEEYEIFCPLQTMTSYDEINSEEIIEQGVYEFFGGKSLKDAEPVLRLQMEKELVLHRYKKSFALNKELVEWKLQGKEVKAEFPYMLEVGDREADVLYQSWLKKENAYSRYSLENEDLELLSDVSDHQLIQLVIGAAREEQRSEVGNASDAVPGAAGQTSGTIDELKPLVLADGGSGLRLFHHFQTDENDNILEMDGMAGLERGAFAEKQEERKAAKDYYQYCTAFPIGTMLAQTWSEEICREVGKAVGREMNEFGVHIWLAPSINIHRNPLCGRNFEYYSEDPLVTGRMAAAVCMGVQDNPQAAVTIKHFAANNQELYRHSSDSIVSERALREIYLKPFEIVIKTAHPLAIMTSYNRLNGVQTANRRDLCTTVVREEWGFDGFLMTDWGTTDPGDSDPVVCVQCGNDLVMPGGENDRRRLEQALEEGRLSRKELELAAAHIAGVIRRLRS